MDSTERARQLIKTLQIILANASRPAEENALEAAYRASKRDYERRCDLDEDKDSE